MRRTELPVPAYQGPYAKYCAEFIAYKRALGYKYRSESHILVLFDKLSSNFNAANDALSKDLVDIFVAFRRDEAPKSRLIRAGVIREFSIFLNEQGVPAYILPKQRKTATSFIPYIFEKDEVVKLLKSADSIPEHRYSPKAHLIYPVLFRMLYCCGLRVSEAINLKVGDVDLDRGILTIKNTKFGKDRLVPMSETMAGSCRQYADKLHIIAQADAPFFPSTDGRHYSGCAIYCRFRTLLWKAGISHGGRGEGPRLHDLRHTFAVDCLNRWVRQGRDAFVLLPILSAYLGHSTVSGTEKYLRLIPQMHSDIALKTEKTFPGIIPSIAPELWEAAGDE